MSIRIQRLDERAQIPAKVAKLAAGHDLYSIKDCNMCTCSCNSIQQRAVQDLLCLVDLYLVYFDLNSAPPLPRSQIDYAIVLRCSICLAGSLYLGFRVWNGHVELVKAELWFFLSSCRITGFRYVRSYWQ